MVSGFVDRLIDHIKQFECFYKWEQVIVFIICRFSQAVKFTVNLSALRKLSKTLAQHRANIQLRLSCGTDILV